ncbi:MAG: hypothetical protein LBC61_03240 [Candidatus Peribacteria bacterium]|jgi:hypothetical protein|nr:hypothetical protein [Candidatus Peribacteria bacterium]
MTKDKAFSYQITQELTAESTSKIVARLDCVIKVIKNQINVNNNNPANQSTTNPLKSTDFCKVSNHQLIYHIPTSINHKPASTYHIHFATLIF